MEMDIEKLKQERDKVQIEIDKLSYKLQTLSENIAAATEADTANYFDKYIKCVDKGLARFVDKGYTKCIHIVRAYKTSTSWCLEGPGYITYITEDGGRRFSEEPNFLFVELDAIKNGTWEVSFLTKEEYFNERKTYLQELINTTY